MSFFVPVIVGGGRILRLGSSIGCVVLYWQLLFRLLMELARNVNKYNTEPEFYTLDDASVFYCWSLKAKSAGFRNTSKYSINEDYYS